MPDCSSVDWSGRIDLLSTGRRGSHEDSAAGIGAGDEAALFHARELMGEAAAMPSHGRGEFVLTQLAVANVDKPTKHPVIRIGESGGGANLFRDARPHGLGSRLPGVPETHLHVTKRLIHRT